MNDKPKPPVPNEERIRVLALNDARQLLEFNEVELAEWMMHFEGYPKDDKQIAECERESFIDYNEEVDGVLWDYVVWLWDYDKLTHQGYGFKTEDEAYEFFVIHYNDIREKLGIIKTRSTPEQIAWAREYWKALSDEELYGFYNEYIKPTNHTYPEVDLETTFRDYLFISASESDYARRHDI